jgi:hypothetical protein
MKNFTWTLLVVIALLKTSFATAGTSPIALALAAPVQVPGSDFTITGVRTSVLWGDHQNVSGIDFGGIGNITSGSFNGLALSGLFNYNKGMSTIIGLQLAGAANININKARVIGFQLALGVNSNGAESFLVGAQIAGLANYSPFTDTVGFQVSLYNRAHNLVGFQIGLVNDADDLHGIQLGLLNFNRKGMFSVAPLINVGF